MKAALPFALLAVASQAGAQTPAPPSPPVVDWGGGFLSAPAILPGGGASLTAGAGPEAPPTPAAQCAAMAAYAVKGARNPNQARFARIPDAPTAVTKAEFVPAERDLPEACRLTGVVAPNINFELTLPTLKWNGKLVHYGCGGPCGQIYRAQAEEPLSRGYAVVASDMGHQGASWSSLYRFANLEAVIDFGFRATHVVTVAAKDIVDAYYARAPKLSYFMGCSTGGVQGMIEAQRYPYDFDAILVGAPAYESGPNFLEWSARANLDAEGHSIMGPEKLPMVRKAVLAACDKLDGLVDGLIQDPTKCHWDPGAIACPRGVSTANCLTPAEVAVIRKIYSGPVDSQGRSYTYGPAGMARGSEYGWSPSFINSGQIPSQWAPDVGSSFGDGIYPVAAANAGKAYDYDLDPKRGWLFFGGPVLQWMRYAGNPDLRRFRDNGGKMILYHGWDDNEVAAGASVDYYRLATATMGGEAPTQAFFRLFMIPGMGHCRRGPGGDSADMLTALETWREGAKAPDALIVHHLVAEQNYLGLPRLRYPLPAGSFDRTRPVYPYPDVAAYSGHGDPKAAQNWMRAPRAKTDPS